MIYQREKCETKRESYLLFPGSR